MHKQIYKKVVPKEYKLFSFIILKEVRETQLQEGGEGKGSKKRGRER